MTIRIRDINVNLPEQNVSFIRHFGVVRTGRDWDQSFHLQNTSSPLKEDWYIKEELKNPKRIRSKSLYKRRATHRPANWNIVF